ncbi:MAG: GNAT family N-acetyltransferase [Candidatus Hydrogenedentes bacterium]|nr:GNAT family N-acetyltransferase [Candidatus Hydrogenedentota bacterium]
MSPVPSAYRIAVATPEHLPALAGIERAATVLFPEEDVPLELRWGTTDPGALEAACNNGTLWVALDARGAAVGFACAEQQGSCAHLGEVDVLPEHGRQGLGARLVQAVIQWAREAGLSAVTLTTFRHLPWNAPFYARLGFLEVSPDELEDHLRAILERETDSGLDPAKRVAMALRC